MNILNNIEPDKLIKVIFTDDHGKQCVDFIKAGKSVITGNEFISSDISSVGYVIDEYELKYYKKNPLEYIQASHDNYFLARSLNVNIKTVVNKDRSTLVSKYKTKLINFVKNSYCRKKLNSEIIDNINSIKDDAILLQYMPMDNFYRDINKSRKYDHINVIRVKLYLLLFSGEQKFVEIFDRERIWATKCINYFNIPELSFINFTIPNQSIVDKMKPMWLTLIEESKTKALSLLEEELTSAKKYGDIETVKEIEIIKEEIITTIKNINLDNCKTPLDIMMFWPDILAPGPALLYPYASCFDSYQTTISMY